MRSFAAWSLLVLGGSLLLYCAVLMFGYLLLGAAGAGLLVLGLKVRRDAIKARQVQTHDIPIRIEFHDDEPKVRFK